jgi:diguanylate cyclase
VPDTTDWKQKYRDSLTELQAEEDRWRHVEQVLRRLVGRLCAAGMGVDPQLDDELRALAAANRRNADAEELARMADSLTSVVVAVDAVAPVLQSAPGVRAVAPGAAAPPAVTAPAVAHSGVAPPGAAVTAVQSALIALLNQLNLDADQNQLKVGLLAELAGPHDDAAFALIVGRAAELIRAYGDSVARERLHAASVLGEVTRRLEEMAGYLTETNHASQQRYDDAQSHNESMMWQVRELTGEVSSATELGLLQSLVTMRLERVTREVCDFRAREESRMMEYSGRAEQMGARITQLEREAQELHAKLDGEKHRARLDPLTGVANRKSFDERLAMEIARRQRIAAAGVMLLWDIDDFKLINDTYGHRAGDLVLKNVAGCFKSAARRACDLAARIGGEEFALFLDGIGLSEAMRMADDVRMAVESLRFHFRGTPVRVTVSCGITELQSPDSADAAFDRADSALYRAKRAGKNLCIAA